MLVREYMSQPVISADPTTPITEALKTMRERGIRRLPVVDATGRLRGIVSDRDLLHAAPSQATSLSIWEITYLLGRITVEKVMSKEVLTVGPDTPVERAAQIMVDHKIGGLPVLDGGNLVGVITETDIFRLFTTLLGARESGVALTATAPDRPGLLADLTGATARAGGDVRSIVTYPADGGSKATVFLKVTGVSTEELTEAIRPHVERIEDVRPDGSGS
jgi:acetoin utilization protein AcuB